MPFARIQNGLSYRVVLATASHAISTRTLFSVFYKPRTSRSEFIVSVNKYVGPQSHKLSVGMRFKMGFEGDEVPERRFSGTIVGVGEKTSTRWPNSEWRSLKIQWDEPSPILRPDRVLPWEIEPLVATTHPVCQPPQRNKRNRPPDLSTSMQELSGHGNARELFPSPKISVASKPTTLNWSNHGSSHLGPSRSICWPNQAETDQESFAPVSEKRQANGYRLLGYRAVASESFGGLVNFFPQMRTGILFSRMKELWFVSCWNENE